MKAKNLRKFQSLTTMLMAALVMSLLTPLALATNESSATITAETTWVTERLDPYLEEEVEIASFSTKEPPLAVVNAAGVGENADLVKLSGNKQAAEYSTAVWITDQQGTPVSDCQANKTYTVHIYLRCSGQSGAAAQDVVLQWQTMFDGDRAKIISMSPSLYWTNEVGERYQRNLFTLHWPTGFNCYFAGNLLVKAADGLTLETYEGQDVDRCVGVWLKELPNGLDQAVEITYDMEVAERTVTSSVTVADASSDQTEMVDPEVSGNVFPEEKSDNVALEHALSPATPPTDAPVLEVISPTELGDAKTASWETYSEAELPDHKVINSIVDNPDWGDERQFLQITDLATGTQSRSSMVLTAGGTYEVTIYLRNGYGSSSSSGKFWVNLQAPLPLRMTAGEVTNFTATANSDEALPGVISTNVQLLSREDLTLKYVDGSATVYTNASTAPSSLDYERLLTGNYNFLIYGGMDNAKWVTYTIAAVATPNGTYIDDSAAWDGMLSSFGEQNGVLATTMTGRDTGFSVFQTTIASLMLGIAIGIMVDAFVLRKKLGNKPITKE